LKNDNKPVLYLIPSPLDEDFSVNQIPANVAETIAHLRHFAVEDLRHARRYLRKLLPELVIDDCQFFEVNKRSTESDLHPIQAVLKAGFSVGMISEAGLPGVADPGSNLVALAHKYNFKVQPLIGPGSIFLALMASGFNGQSFTFHGYLPKERGDRQRKIKELESTVIRTGYTQIFMETPFRNQHLLEDLLEGCLPTTMLCLAVTITTQSENIRTQSIDQWKKAVPNIQKKPAIFLIGKS
jgi:16S rRNA (cytidine1402-2'-O)-methyltransferase